MLVDFVSVNERLKHAIYGAKVRGVGFTGHPNTTDLYNTGSGIHETKI